MKHRVALIIMVVGLLSLGLSISDGGITRHEQFMTGGGYGDSNGGADYDYQGNAKSDGWADYTDYRIDGVSGTNGQVVVGQTGAGPLWKTVSGDVALDENGAASLDQTRDDVVNTLTATAGVTSTSTVLGANRFGNLRIGRMSSHADTYSGIENVNNTGYTIMSDDSGNTFINADTGGTIYLRINNGDLLTINAAGLITFTPAFAFSDDDGTLGSNTTADLLTFLANTMKFGGSAAFDNDTSTLGSNTTSGLITFLATSMKFGGPVAFGSDVATIGSNTTADLIQFLSTYIMLGGDLYLNGKKIVFDSDADSDPSLSYVNERYEFEGEDGNTLFYIYETGKVEVENTPFVVDTDSLFVEPNEVGINTATPYTALHVIKANQTLTGWATGAAAVGKGHAGFMTADTGGAADIGATIGLGGTYNTAGNEVFYGLIAGRKSNANTSSGDGYLAFYTQNGETGLEEWMRILSTSGDVGFGTATPSDDIEILRTDGVGIQGTRNDTAVVDDDLYVALSGVTNDTEASSSTKTGSIEIRADGAQAGAHPKAKLEIKLASGTGASAVVATFDTDDGLVIPAGKTTGNWTVGGALITSVSGFDYDDTTPSVAGGNVFTTDGDGTTLTDLQGGTVGQVVILIGDDVGNTSIADGGNFALSAGITLGDGDTITLVLYGSTWYETSRSDN